MLSSSLGPSLAAILYAGMLDPEIRAMLAGWTLRLRAPSWIAGGAWVYFVARLAGG